MSDTAELTYQKLMADLGVVTGAKRREQITQAAKDYPEHPGIQAMEAERVLWTGDLDGCRAILEPSKEQRPNDPNLDAVNALLVGYLGDLIEADRIFDDVLRRDPTNTIALMNHPGVLVLLDQTEKAFEIMSTAESLYPDNVQILASSWTGYRMLEADDRADVIMAKIGDREHDLVAMMKARQAMKNSDFVESEKWAREAVALNPESRAGWEHLAMLLNHKGELTEAKSAATFALELNSRSPLALQQLSKIAGKQGDKALALEYEKRADEAVPFLKDHTEIRKLTKLMRMGRVDESLKGYRQMMTAQSASTRKLAANCALRALSTNVERKDALAILDQIREVSGETALYFGTRALVEMGQGRPDDAFATLDQGLEKYPDNFDLLADKMKCIGQTGDKQAVVTMAEDLLAKGITSPIKYLSIANVLFQHNLDETAEKYYQDLIRKFPSSSVVTMMEGMMELQKGNIGFAMQKLNAANHHNGMPKLRIGCFSIFKVFFKILGTLILVKLGLKKRKPKDDDPS